jgi:hypothetical protein
VLLDKINENDGLGIIKDKNPRPISVSLTEFK